MIDSLLRQPPHPRPHAWDVEMQGVESRQSDLSRFGVIDARVVHALSPVLPLRLEFKAVGGRMRLLQFAT